MSQHTQIPGLYRQLPKSPTAIGGCPLKGVALDPCASPFYPSSLAIEEHPFSVGVYGMLHPNRSIGLNIWDGSTDSDIQ